MRPPRAQDATVSANSEDHPSDRDRGGGRAGDAGPGPSYEVGYGKPPVHTRFKKGQSGNPRGRENGQKNLITLLHEEGDVLVQVMENGKRKTLPKKQVAAKAAWNVFVKGKSIDQMVKISDRVESRGGGSQGGLPHDGQSLSSQDQAMLDFFRRRAIEEHAARKGAKGTAAQPSGSTEHARDGSPRGAGNGDGHGPKVSTDSDDDVPQ